jgi:xylulokinase
MALAAGIDSSTQACKVVIRDADTGERIRSGRAPHPAGTEVDPESWWIALEQAIAAAGGLDDVAAISVAGQQHGMICLDDDGHVVRPALLWNDTRSAPQAADLVEDIGAEEWVAAVGSVPVASFTITKLRWLAEHEPDNAARTAAVCLPHDWLSWKLSGSTDVDDLVTDRSDASGTGYFDGRHNSYRRDLLIKALGHDVLLPRVAGPREAGFDAGGLLLGPGAGDNAAAAFGLHGASGVIVSVGTSGTVFGRSERQPHDPGGLVAGFADLTGAFLPLVCTLNAARVLDVTARMLGVSFAELDHLASAAPPGAGGLVMVPYLEGERTPNAPLAAGALHGLTLSNTTRECLARAAIEGMLCGLAAGLDALAEWAPVDAVHLIGGGAMSAAVRQIAPSVFGVPVRVPAPGEYVADGAARQAAWVLSGGDAPPTWGTGPALAYEANVTPGLRGRYAEAAELYLNR